MTATMTKPNNGQQLATMPQERAVEYVPFGGKDKIKLTVGIVQNIIATRTKQGKLPTEQQIFKFIMLCKARMLNPFEGDAYLVGYDTKDGPVFNLITAHQAFLKRAEVNPEYDGLESGVIVRDAGGVLVDRVGDFFFDDDALMGGWATVHFRTRKYPMTKRLKLGSFRKQYGRWLEDPAGMIAKCAEADALRSSFPTTIGGLYVEQELHVPSPEITFTPPPPVGRQSLRKPAPTPVAAEQEPTLPAPEVAEPVAESPPEREPGIDDEPPPLAEGELSEQQIEAERADWLSDFRVQADAAETVKKGRELGVELAKHADFLGPHYAAALTYLQQKNVRLEQAAAPKGKK